MTDNRLTNRLEKRAIALEERMFEKRSRYLILFVTLTYKPEYRNDITIDDLRRHRDRLLKNAKCNALLKGIEAYIWKIEEGRQSGLHIHLLIFYSGDRRADVYLAKRIGEYWEDVVTRGIGAYWNSNADKARYQERGQAVGVGQVDRGNAGCRDGIRAIIRYMAQPGQAVSGLPRHGRSFGMSEMT